MELVGLLIIILAFVIFAMFSKDKVYQIMYLGTAFVLFIIASRILMYSSQGNFFSIYMISLTILAIFLITIVVFLFKDIIMGAMNRVRLSA